MSLRDRQLLFDREILRQLIACVPESCQSLDYRVEITWHEGYESIEYDLVGPDGHVDVSSKLCEATERLVNLMKEHAMHPRCIRARATDDAGRWTYKATFDYADQNA